MFADGQVCELGGVAACAGVDAGVDDGADAVLATFLRGRTIPANPPPTHTKASARECNRNRSRRRRRKASSGSTRSAWRTQYRARVHCLSWSDATAMFDIAATCWG